MIFHSYVSLPEGISKKNGNGKSTIDRRKFGSQTSDNMDTCKAEMGRVREQKRTEEERSSKRESLRRKKIQAREKVGKSRNTVFFQ